MINRAGQNTNRTFTSTKKYKVMKLLSGIISVVLGFVSLFIMFVKAKSDVEMGVGFGVLLAAIVFMCFMIMEEQKEEVERLRGLILKSKGII
jgi:NO-binding membrane sensor protein with MHYT domain